MTPRELAALLVAHRELRRLRGSVADCPGCQGRAALDDEWLCEAHVIARLIAAEERRPKVEAIVAPSNAYPEGLTLRGTDGLRRSLKEQFARAFRSGDVVEVRLKKAAPRAQVMPFTRELRP